MIASQSSAQDGLESPADQNPAAESPGPGTACRPNGAEQDAEPVVVPRDRHPISRSLIDPDALSIMYRLRNNGYKAYLVGGSVRDLLIGKQPKDFDIGTDARPGQIHRLFRSSFIIGKRFKLVHVRFPRNKVIEVITFRRAPSTDELDRYGAENTFGTPRQDALRRDFTANALFYDIANYSIIDYVGGLRDMQERNLRVIGDPDLRFKEDPVRMLRALEFSARLGFTLDPAAEAALRGNASLITDASRMRLKEELFNLFTLGVSSEVLRRSHDLGLFPHLMQGVAPSENLWKLLGAMDANAGDGRIPEAWFILTTLHFPSLHAQMPSLLNENLDTVLHVIETMVAPFSTYYGLGSQTSHLARELLLSLWRLYRGRGCRGEFKFMKRESYRLAMDFLKIWSCASGLDSHVSEEWHAPVSKEGARQGAQGRRRRGRRWRGKPREEKTGPQDPPGFAEQEMRKDIT